MNVFCAENNITEQSLMMFSYFMPQESVFSCYNQMQEIERRMIKTPPPNLLSTHFISTDVLENSSLSSSGTKRKLAFEGSEDCPVQRTRRA